MTRLEQPTVPAPDLRERRRRELTRTIANAAVELFERDGYAATTVDDIAAAAGISRTTFFRHCAGKEAAVLVDDAGLETHLLGIAAAASPARPLHDLESAWTQLTGVFDADPDGYDRFLRVRRLMRENPSLHAAGLERDARLTEQLAEALIGGPALAALDAHAVAESFALGMRLTFDEWVRRADGAGGDIPSLGDVYADVRSALARSGQGATR